MIDSTRNSHQHILFKRFVGIMFLLLTAQFGAQANAAKVWICEASANTSVEPASNVGVQMIYPISDLFASSEPDTEATKLHFRTAFRNYVEQKTPGVAWYREWLQSKHGTDNLSSFSCSAFDSYDEAVSYKGGLNPSVISETHWVPEGSTLATAPKPQSSPVPPPLDGKTSQSGSSTAEDPSQTSNNAPQKKSVSTPCNKVNSVHVVSEIRNNPSAGIHDLHLTITNSASAAVTCSFIAHKNGAWGTPGREDINPGQTVSFNPDFGDVSNPVAYRCVLQEDAKTKTTCFPPKWWLSVNSTPHK